MGAFGVSSLPPMKTLADPNAGGRSQRAACMLLGRSGPSLAQSTKVMAQEWLLAFSEPHPTSSPASFVLSLTCHSLFIPLFLSFSSCSLGLSA